MNRMKPSSDEPAIGAQPAPAKKGRGRPKLVPDDMLRARIVEEGLAMFIEHGYGRATMDELAGRMHLSKQTLYRFFAGKAALFAAVVDEHRQSMLALPGDYDHLPLADALAAIFLINIDPAAERARAALIDVVLREAGTHPELHEAMLRNGIERSRDELADWLTRQAERGRLEIDSPLDYAGILMDMIFGPSFRVLTPAADEASLAALRRDHIRRCIDVFLYGVVPR